MKHSGFPIKIKPKKFAQSRIKTSRKSKDKLDMICDGNKTFYAFKFKNEETLLKKPASKNNNDLLPVSSPSKPSRPIPPNPVKSPAPKFPEDLVQLSVTAASLHPPPFQLDAPDRLSLPAWPLELAEPPGKRKAAGEDVGEVEEEQPREMHFVQNLEVKYTRKNTVKKDSKKVGAGVQTEDQEGQLVLARFLRVKEGRVKFRVWKALQKVREDGALSLIDQLLIGQ